MSEWLGDLSMEGPSMLQSFGYVIWSQGGQCGVAFETPDTAVDVDRLRDDSNIWRLCDLTPDQLAAAEARELGVSR